MSAHILILDVDNTLYDHKNSRIPALNLKALAWLRKKGWKIVLCTGRPLSLLENLMEIHPGDYDAIIAGAGCAVYDKNLHPIKTVELSRKQKEQLFALAKKLDCSLFCTGEDMALSRMDEPAKKMLESLEIHGIPIRNPQLDESYSLVEFLRDDPSKPLCGAEEIEGIKVVYFPLFTDVNPAGTDKTDGIETLMKHWNLPVHDYIAFGDSVNDLEMLKHASTGVAMANGSKEVKEAADEIAPECEKAGIALWLMEKGLVPNDL